MEKAPEEKEIVSTMCARLIVEFQNEKLAVVVKRMCFGREMLCDAVWQVKVDRVQQQRTGRSEFRNLKSEGASFGRCQKEFQGHSPRHDISDDKLKIMTPPTPAYGQKIRKAPGYAGSAAVLNAMRSLNSTRKEGWT